MKLIVLKGDVDFKNLEENFFGDAFWEGKVIETDDEDLEFIKRLEINYDEQSLKPRVDIVDKQKQCALDMFAGFIGENEKIESYRFGINMKEMEVVQKGCPILSAKTDRAEYMLIFDEYDYRKGAVFANEFVSGNYNPNGSMRINPLLNLFISEFAGALGKTLADALFSKFFPKNNDDKIREELDKLKNDLRQILQEMKLEGFTDTLIGSRRWLRDEYSIIQGTYLNASDETRNVRKAEETYNDLKSRTSSLADIVEILEKRISNNELAQCDFMTRGKVLLYASAASLRAILLKEQIFWDKELARLKKEPYDRSLEGVFDNFVINIPKTVETYLSGLRNGRYGKLYGVDDKSKDQLLPPITKDWAASKVYWFEWGDRFSSAQADDPFIGKAIHSEYKYIPEGKDANKGTRRKEAEADKNRHTEAVQKLFVETIENPLNDVKQKFREAKLLN